MTRFFAHLCLYLRMIDIPVRPLATQVIPEAYLQVLEFERILNWNLKRALELANIVADSMYKLYDDFLHLDGRRLGEYLDAARRATIAGSVDRILS
ncbi:hypothetical protein BDR05DRAFT_999112 [Suillus weaverae]|nr:hypothetical protein BDR05DRAFT_999112 [Suillus weaverae]